PRQPEQGVRRVADADRGGQAWPWLRDPAHLLPHRRRALLRPAQRAHPRDDEHRGPVARDGRLRAAAAVRLRAAGAGVRQRELHGPPARCGCGRGRRRTHLQAHGGAEPGHPERYEQPRPGLRDRAQLLRARRARGRGAGPHVVRGRDPRRHRAAAARVLVRPAAARRGGRRAPARMSIPIRNVYYMLCYAWDHWAEGEMVSLDDVDFDRTQDLLAHVLAEGTARLLKRGLDRGYIPIADDVPGIRGKLDFAATSKRALLARARTHCQFDELRHDVLHNRILKATLGQLMRLDALDDDVRGRVARVHRRLDAVSGVPITRKDFRSVQLHRNNRFYDFLLRLCLLIHDQLIPDPGTGIGRTRFRDFRDDEARMWEIFEQFVHNFFRREQQAFRVRAQPVVAWHDAQGEPDHLARLPEMRPDLVLDGADRCIVLDTKFYKEALSERYGARKLHSGNLYQLFTYVHNRAAAHGNLPAHEGMLLYPV